MLRDACLPGASTLKALLSQPAQTRSELAEQVRILKLLWRLQECMGGYDKKLQEFVAERNSVIERDKNNFESYVNVIKRHKDILEETQQDNFAKICDVLQLDQHALNLLICSTLTERHKMEHKITRADPPEWLSAAVARDIENSLEREKERFKPVIKRWVNDVQNFAEDRVNRTIQQEEGSSDRDRFTEKVAGYYASDLVCSTQKITEL